MEAIGIRHYENSPMPSELDEELGVIVDDFAELSDSDRAAVLAVVDSAVRSMLFFFVKRMAIVAVRERSPARLLRGFIGLAMEGNSDFRDTASSRALLFYSGRRLNVDCFEMLGKSLNLVGPTAFRWSKDCPVARSYIPSIGSVGYKAVVAQDGFDYECVGHPWLDGLFAVLEVLLAPLFWLQRRLSRRASDAK